jgi:hypothetical protein
VPLARRHALDALRDGEVLTTSEVARRMRSDYRVARIALEDLELLGVVRGERRKVGDSDGADEDGEDPRNRRKPRDWSLLGDDGKTAARVLGEVCRSVESTPPSPPNCCEGPHSSANAGEREF